MDGLAAQVGGQPTTPPQLMGRQVGGQGRQVGGQGRQVGGQGRGQRQQQRQGKMPSVEEVIALLMQGVDPQKLIEMGIPQELIMQAIQVLEQQLAQQEQSSAPVEPAPQAQGLAAQSAGVV